MLWQKYALYDHKASRRYLREIDIDKKELRLEILGKLFPYKYPDNVKIEELESKLGGFVRLIFHDGVLKLLC